MEDVKMATNYKSISGVVSPKLKKKRKLLQHVDDAVWNYATAIGAKLGAGTALAYCIDIASSVPVAGDLAGPGGLDRIASNGLVGSGFTAGTLANKETVITGLVAGGVCESRNLYYLITTGDVQTTANKVAADGILWGAGFLGGVASRALYEFGDAFSDMGKSLYKSMGIFFK